MKLKHWRSIGKTIFNGAAVIIFLGIIFGLGASSADAQVHIYVDQQNGVNSQTTTGAESDPFKSITYAMGVMNQNGALDPWVVHIKAGTYDNDPNKPASEREIFPINLRNNITIQGDDGAESCIISGAYNESSNSPLFKGENLTDITVQNLSFQDMNRTGNLNPFNGGAIELINCSGTLQSCIIRNNTVDGNGGGMWLSVPSMETFTIDNNQFMNNTSDSGKNDFGHGGGFYVSGDLSGTISNNTFSGNSSSSYSCGGGFYINNNLTGDITNNTISGNSASSSYSYGGGFYIGDNLTGDITNNTISGNSSSSSYSYGGGFYVKNDFDGYITNNKIEGNASHYGGVFYIGGNFVKDITGNSFVKNTAGKSGGCFYVKGTFTGYIVNNTFMGNKSNSSGNTYGGVGYIQSAFDGGISENIFIKNSSVSDKDAVGGCFYFSSSYTGNITDNVFVGNSASDSGGVFVMNGFFSGKISGNIFSNNSGSTGAGFCLWSDAGNAGDVIISNNYFIGNYISVTDKMRGSAFWTNRNATIFNNTFYEDGSTQSCINLTSYTTDAIIRNNIFNNVHTAIWEESDPDYPMTHNNFVNVTDAVHRNNIAMGNDLLFIGFTLSNFKNNQSWDSGFVGLNIASGTWTKDAVYSSANNYTILTDGTQTFTDYSLKGALLKIQEMHFPIVSYTDTEIMVTGDLTAAGLGKQGNDYSIDDFRLASDSQNIDAGYDVAQTVATDFEGHTRPQGDGVDIGADEVYGGPLIVMPSPAVTDIGLTKATLNANIIPNGHETTYYFDYGVTTNYGSKTPEKTAGSGTTPVAIAENLTNLLPETEYFFRIVATNAQGTTEGPGMSFSTLFQNKKAIIVSGGGPFSGNNIWEPTKMCANYAYNALLYQGYSKENIQYLSPVTTIDADNDGLENDVDETLTSQTLMNAVTIWAKEAELDDVLIYMVDHGGDGSFRLNETESVLATDFDNWLDSLQEVMTGKLIIIYDACRSGSFIPLLTPPEGKERIILTSASADHPAYFLSEGKLSFSFQFWADIYNGSPLDNSFYFGKDMMSKFQTAHFEADGDGVPDEKDDQAGMNNFYIGWGRARLSDIPVISDLTVEPANIIEGSSAMLTASGIEDMDGIDRVWALIMPPNYDPGSPDTPITSLPTVDFTGPDKNGDYSLTYNGFTEAGDYTISVYAHDAENNYYYNDVYKNFLFRFDI